MNCPYQDSLVPRCQIAFHPDRQNIEYCRVCGEWRYLDSIGRDHANLLWLIWAVAIVSLVIGGILNTTGQSVHQEHAPAPLQPSTK